jgi:hypothetical protein
MALYFSSRPLECLQDRKTTFLAIYKLRLFVYLFNDDLILFVAIEEKGFYKNYEFWKLKISK